MAHADSPSLVVRADEPSLPVRAGESMDSPDCPVDSQVVDCPVDTEAELVASLPVQLMSRWTVRLRWTPPRRSSLRGGADSRALGVMWTYLQFGPLEHFKSVKSVLRQQPQFTLTW